MTVETEGLDSSAISASLHSGPIRVLVATGDEIAAARINAMIGELDADDIETDVATTFDDVVSSLMQRQHTVCLISDLACGRSGLDVLREADALGFDIPFIVLGSARERELDRKALHYGAADYLVKERLTADEIERAIRFSIERHRTTTALSRLAMFDDLTGLYNRSMFHELLRNAISRARRASRRLTLMFLDLDRFKYVNDTLGHRYGDLLLKEVAKRIRSCLRESDMVCRLGGDEFTLILEGALSHMDAATVARKVLTQVSAPYQLEGKECFVSVSIGIAVYPEGAEDADTLIRNADLAMYRAKSKGRACFEFFTPEFSDAARRRVAIEDALREALDKGGLSLMYQPQLDLRLGRITTMEALVRLNHPALGVVSPGEFIPIAEEAGLIHRVGDWVLAQACREAAGWSAEGLDHLRVAVNVSPRQFQQPDIIETIRTALDSTGLAPERLDLELTESHLAGDPDAAAAVLTRLRAMGVGTAIDDFGTGYSSLAVLKRLPVSWLKIDRSFVSGLPNNADDAAIATAIIGLAHSLNLRAIAEGVETEAQFRFLRSRGCDAIQGYLLAEPLNADDIPGWFERMRRDELLRQIIAA